jgi:predicted transposase YdaD
MKLLNPLEQMFFDDGVKSGLKRGLEQGLEQGRTEGAAALLERLLTQRFGPLPQTVRKKLAKASVAQVEAWSDALAEAQSLKQVFNP